jgi:hypothetical protein
MNPQIPQIAQILALKENYSARWRGANDQRIEVEAAGP